MTGQKPSAGLSGGTKLMLLLPPGPVGDGRYWVSVAVGLPLESVRVISEVTRGEAMNSVTVAVGLPSESVRVTSVERSDSSSGTVAVGGPAEAVRVRTTGTSSAFGGMVAVGLPVLSRSIMIACVCTAPAGTRAVVTWPDESVSVMIWPPPSPRTDSPGCSVRVTGTGTAVLNVDRTPPTVVTPSASAVVIRTVVTGPSPPARAGATVAVGAESGPAPGIGVCGHFSRAYCVNADILNRFRSRCATSRSAVFQASQQLRSWKIIAAW